MELSEILMKSTNMVEITEVIWGKVWLKYVEMFCQTERKFNRQKESQRDWVNSIKEKYQNQMDLERKELFNLIPERFFKTKMYIDLKKKIDGI